MPNAKMRISPIVASFMIGLALVYDTLKFLLSFILMGWVVAIWSFLTFWFWFTYLGVSFMKPGKMRGAKIASLSVPAIIGILPFISALPGETLGVTTTIGIASAEDLTKGITPEVAQALGSGLKQFKGGGIGH